MISTQKRLGLLAGLFLFSVLVVVLAVPTAQAAGPGTTSSTAQSLPAVTVPAGTQGFRGGINEATRTQLVSSGTQSIPSSTSSTTAWIAAGSAAALLIIGLAAWAPLRRRELAGAPGSAAFCAQHPEDSLCAAA